MTGLKTCIAILLLGCALTSCKKETIQEQVDAAGMIDGLYKGTLTIQDEDIEGELLAVHKVDDYRVRIQPDASSGEGKFNSFQMDLEKDGAAIHHVLGTEEQGTLVLDLANHPLPLAIHLPGGISFEGTQVKAYKE